MSRNAKVSGIYRDRVSQESIVVEIDEQCRAKTRIRGVAFRGKAGIEWLVPESEADAEDAGFVLNEGSLWDCEFTLEIPAWISTDSSGLSGWVAPPSDYSNRKWELRKPMPQDAGQKMLAHVSCGVADPDETSVVLALNMDGLRVESSGEEGCFEYELKNLQSLIPEYAFSFDDSLHLFSWG